MKYRLYVDESGDHTWSDQTDVGKRYLGVVGVAMALDLIVEFGRTLEDLKRRHLPYDADNPPILHRTDIVNKRAPFSCLRDEHPERAFNDALCELIRRTNFKVFAVVIDKMSHGKKEYRTLRNPYHYCLTALLERYCGWLRYIRARGDLMAESRGGREDRDLKEAYASVFQYGTSYMNKTEAQGTLTSGEAKVKQKSANIAGLQLADVLAYPLTRDVLVAFNRLPNCGSAFSSRIATLVYPKYNQWALAGRVNGYGRVLLE